MLVIYYIVYNWLSGYLTPYATVIDGSFTETAHFNDPNINLGKYFSLKTHSFAF
jgi:hypothetical protein